MRQSGLKLLTGTAAVFFLALVLYSCAQVQKNTAVAPATPTAPKQTQTLSLQAPDPAFEPVEGPTDLPTPGPPFARYNRNADVVLKDFALDAVGNVDWVKALTDKKIQPRGSLEGNKPEMPPFPLNVEIPAVGAMPDVIFPHGPHTMWLACGNCHPGIFIMKKGSNPISMVKIVNGQFCGRCHGRVAFPIANCSRCHVKPKEESAAK